MNDVIAEAYLKILEGRVLEMAMPITRSVGDLDAASEQTLYKNLAAKHSDSKEILGHDVHKADFGGMVVYVAKDKQGNVSAMTTLNKLPPNNHCKTDHFTQDIVMQSRKFSTAGLSREILWKHISEHKLPLVSSNEQTMGGQKMWRKFVHEALDNGHEVQYFDGNEHHETTKRNVESHLAGYLNDVGSPSIKKYLIVNPK